MFYTICGEIVGSGEKHIVLENSGIGFFVMTTDLCVKEALKIKGKVKFFCSLFIRDEKPELFGFLEIQTKYLFDLLNTVSGIGPKTALAILNVDSIENITAAILEKRPDLLYRTPGIGKKTAERIILELNTKLKMPSSSEVVSSIEANNEIEEILVGLGYSRPEARSAISEIPKETDTFDLKLKYVLKSVSMKKSEKK